MARRRGRGVVGEGEDLRAGARARLRWRGSGREGGERGSESEDTRRQRHLRRALRRARVGISIGTSGGSAHATGVEDPLPLPLGYVAAPDAQGLRGAPRYVDAAKALRHLLGARHAQQCRYKLRLVRVRGAGEREAHGVWLGVGVRVRVRIRHALGLLFVV